MKFIDLMKKIHLNTPIEIYYDDCEFVREGENYVTNYM